MKVGENCFHSRRAACKKDFDFLFPSRCIQVLHLGFKISAMVIPILPFDISILYVPLYVVEKMLLCAVIL